MIRRILPITNYLSPPRNARSVEKYTLVDCTQKACAYYLPEPSSSKMCRCIHPEKPNYMVGRCPLYKLDWQKASKLNPPPASRKR